MIYNLLDSINRSNVYPEQVTVLATYNCATISLDITSDWTEQMVMELPSINFKIYKSDGIIYSSFDIDLDTFEIDSNKGIKASSAYSIPIYDIPQISKISITPMFDNQAIASHNNLVETGIIEGDLWETQTQEFPITIKLDNSNIASGGGSSGGGGGGGGTAEDTSFDNTGTGLSATTVQDALVELLALTNTVSIINLILSSSGWDQNGEYTISNAAIKSTSSLYLDIPDDITKEQYDSIASANINAISQSSGKLVLKAMGDIPTIDLPITLTIQNKNPNI